MRYLLDTCVVSEFIKKTPSAEVLSWILKQDERSFYLSVVTLGEIRKGISQLTPSRRKDELEEWLDGALRFRFQGRILDVDLEVSLEWGRIQAETERKGRKVPVLDALIAATAMRYGLTVATVNMRDFEPTGVPCLNPDIGQRTEGR